MTIAIGLVTSFILVLLCTPPMIYLGDKLDVVAKPNQRTVHKGRIVRIGGLAIYVSFMLTSAFILKADRQLNAILIAGFVIMLSGLLDDLMNLKPIGKLIFQVLAASILIFGGGISLKQIALPFNTIIDFGTLSILVTYLWILGITNAINLMDGLDGLVAGIASIMLTSIGIMSLSSQREDIAIICAILVGSCVGFLRFNFYPAKVFMGDCGALFLGFMIASISLLGFGFKTTAFISLGAPIIILALPILDTLLAVIRRKIQGKKFSDADKEHIHHTIMYKLKLSHKHTVIAIYIVTILFSIAAYVLTKNKWVGFYMLIVLGVIMYLFIEYTGMLSKRYHPILSLFGIRRKHEKTK